MKKQILIVDDDEKIRKYFSLVLAAENRQIHEAASGNEALEILEGQSVDLILLDLNMPGLDGVATLRAIREMDATVPVYIVTAFQTEFRDRLKAMKQNGIDFEVLNKPVERAELAMAVAGALDGPLAERAEKIRFYVVGRNAAINQAVADFLALLRERASIHCQIEVIDVLENPTAAGNDNVFVTPTVIRVSGDRPCRVIGDISHPEKMAQMLGLL